MTAHSAAAQPINKRRKLDQPPPLSAVAARKAATAAAALLAAPAPIETDSEAEDDEETENGNGNGNGNGNANELREDESEQDSSQSESDRDEDDDDDAEDDETKAEAAMLAKREKKLLRSKKKEKGKGKGSGRYFSGSTTAAAAAGGQNLPSTDASASASASAMEVDLDEEEGGNGAGVPMLPIGGGSGRTKMGRGKRQRREKSAFLDPMCLSNFSPVLGSNIHFVRWTLANGTQEEGYVCCLNEDETLIIHGTYHLTPLHGLIGLQGGILSSSPSVSPISFPLPPSFSPHPIFSPSSHPLPVLSVLPSHHSSTPLLLSLGESLEIDLAAYDAVVLLSSAETGIEGLEKVLRSAGMGAGNGMWEVGLGEAGYVKEGEKRWGGKGWNIVRELTPGLTSFRRMESWEDALSGLGMKLKGRKVETMDADEEHDEDEEEEMDVNAGSERMVLLVQGPKRVGKSSFAKLLLNRLLSKYEQVAYLDTDLGQPEFTPPGLVSLSVLSHPVFGNSSAPSSSSHPHSFFRSLTGPSFTHLSLPLSSHFLGTSSPASNPSGYLSAITSLLATYALSVEFPLIDDVPSTSSKTTKTRSPAQRKVRDRVPLVVNTQGWVKGLGADLLAQIKDACGVTGMFIFGGEEGNEDGAFGEARPYNSHVVEGEFEGRVWKMDPAPSSPLDSKWSAADLRTLALVSYFHSKFPSPSSASRTTNIFPSQWDFNLPLISVRPYSLDWTNRKLFNGAYILDNGEIEYSHILHALNASVVGIVITHDDDDAISSTATSKSFPYSPSFPSPSPSNTTCHSLALIRSIDPALKSLHILTPSLPDEKLGPVKLVKGEIELPLCLMMDFQGAEDEREKGIKGVMWRDVPFLEIEGKGLVDDGRKKGRRNLMRRGQN